MQERADDRGDDEQRDDDQRQPRGPVPQQSRADAIATPIDALLTDARIDGHVQQVGEQVADDDHHRSDDHRRGDEIVVARADGVRREQTHARPREDSSRRTPRRRAAPGSRSPSSVIIGVSALRKAWRQTISRSGKPFARAVRM